ncbi:hypothetical protein [Luteolibacter soli]|uniref:Calx-beta domain-containing protein n=1 Tax=Luteolibacter soli TaxID=3135280 RepID=A0ABU9AX96_9BACT
MPILRPFRLTLALLTLAFTLLIAPSATAFETFRAATPFTGSASTQKPVVIGPYWAAYVENTGDAVIPDRIRVVNTANGGSLFTFPRPGPRTVLPGSPIWLRTISGTFAAKMVTDGTYIAVLSPVLLERFNGSAFVDPKSIWSIHVWNASNGQFIGAVDIDVFTITEAFCLGITNGRLHCAISTTRSIRQWDIATLAPLPGITIPDGTPPLYGTVEYGTIAIAGNDLVYNAENTDLYHVNLTTGSTTHLIKPPGFPSRSFQSLAVGGGHLLAPYGHTNNSQPCLMLHYDLATMQVVAQTPIPNNKATYPFFGADGTSWRAVSVGYSGEPSELRSGSSITVAGSDAFVLPPAPAPVPSPVSGGFNPTCPRPFALANGFLWFAGGGDFDGTIAYRIAASTQPVATLTGRCLPARESDGKLQALFTLSRPLDHDTVFHVTNPEGIGSASRFDSNLLSTDITIPANQTQATAQITLYQDNVIEEDETVVFEITSQPAEILVPEKQIHGIITGSSLHRLPPVAAWQDTVAPARARPAHITIAGDRLIQTNSPTDAPAGNVPRVLTRPLEGGQWTPSTTLASIPLEWMWVYSNNAGRTLLTSRSSVRVYDPVTDTVPFQRVEASDFNPEVYLGDTHFLFDDRHSILEYPFTPPISGTSPFADGLSDLTGPAVYAQGVILAHFHDAPSKGIRRISDTAGTDDGPLIAGMDIVPGPIAANGNLYAFARDNRVWFSRLDQFPTLGLKPLRPANGPLKYITDLRIVGTRIFVSNGAASEPALIHIFETPSGLEVGTLFAESDEALAAYLPEGATAPAQPGNGYLTLYDLSTADTNIAATIRWQDLRQDDRVAARFIQDTSLPGIVDPAPVHENFGSLDFHLTEAAPFPITVTIRPVPAHHNEAADWTGTEGGPIVIPAGTTTFLHPVRPVDDQLPEGDIAAPFEITLSGNGITRTIRTAVQLIDDDLLPLSEVTHTLQDFGRDFAPVASGWAHLSPPLEENLLAWTGSAAFTHGSLFGFEGSSTFGIAIASTGNWLAVTQGAFGPAKKPKPSQIQIYQPATNGKTPVRILKGMKDVNHFGDTLFARDNTLWVGAPGSNTLLPKPKLTAGQVLQYDLATGKKTRTYKAPKTHALGFGSAITANNTSVSISSPVSGGAVFQHDRAKGKLVRTLVSPTADEDEIFGTTLASTDTGLLIASSQYPDHQIIHAFSATGSLPLWTLSAPAGHRFNTFTLITADILATAGDSLTFYRLPFDDSAPELIVEIPLPADEAFHIRKLQAANGQLALLRDYDGNAEDDVILITLSSIEQLDIILPATAAPLAEAPSQIITPPASPVLTLTQSSTGTWQLHLPSATEAAATATTLEFSTDLTTWQTLATPEANGTWQLSATPESSSITSALPLNATSLQVSPTLPRLFFRLRTP